MMKNNFISTGEISVIIGRGVEDDFIRAIEKYKKKIKGRNAFITIGLEGTADRGVDFVTAEKLFRVMDDHKKMNFMLLLKDEISDTANVPSNCMLGVTVSEVKDAHKIEMLASSNAKKIFVSFVPLLENVTDEIDTELVDDIDYILLEGSPEDDINDWEQELVLMSIDYGHDVLRVYDKSVQKCDYEMDVVSSELFGFNKLNWF